MGNEEPNRRRRPSAPEARPSSRHLESSFFMVLLYRQVKFWQQQAAVGVDDCRYNINVCICPSFRQRATGNSQSKAVPSYAHSGLAFALSNVGQTPTLGIQRVSRARV